MANFTAEIATLNRADLAKRYELVIGYDPFVDDPSRNENDVRATLAEVEALHAEMKE
jgi:hypothetical protein